MRPIAFLLASWMLTVGCSGKNDSGSSTPPGEGHVFAGWNHTWKALSHRLSMAKVALHEDGTFTTGMIGGDWSTGDDNPERATYVLRSSHVTADGFVVGHGEVTVLTGPNGEILQTVSLDVPGLGDAENVTAAFSGFSILTDAPQTADYPEYDPALGYCSNGFGFSVGEPTVSGDTATLTLAGVVRWGPAGPEDPLDRSDMNAAIPFAQTEVTIHYMVIGYVGTLETTSGSGSIDYAHGVYSEQPPLESADLGISLASTSPGFPVIRSFDLGVTVPGTESQGEYLRSYAVELGEGSPMFVSTQMTNSSLVETAAIQFATTVDVGWVTLASDADVEFIQVAGEHEVGTIEVDPFGE